MRSALALGAVVVALTTSADVAGADPGCDPSLPVVAHHAGGAAASVGAARLPVACAVDTGYATSETTIAVTNKGTIVFSPAHTENSLARSLDGGATWGLAYPHDMQYTALWNTVDPFVTVDRRTGRIFWVHATGSTRTLPVLVSESPLPDAAPTALAAASGFQVYASSDEGRSWTTADYQTALTGDWEQIFVGPPAAASTGAPQPKGYPSVVYVCANSPFEVSGPGRLCLRSLDGGATFDPAGYLLGIPGQICPPLATHVGVVARDGTVYLPASCSGGGYVAVSHDEAGSFTWQRIPGAPPSDLVSATLRIAIDDADNLYATWVAGDRVRLVISRDGGKKWSAPIDVTVPGVRGVLLPVVAAGPAGHVGVTYYAAARGDRLTAYVTQTDDALAGNPVFVSAALNDPAHPIFASQGVIGGTIPRTDFVGATYDGAGTFWAGVVKQLGPADARGHLATTGLVGHLAAPADAPSASARPSSKASGHCAGRVLTYRLGRVHGARVVRVTITVNGRRVLVRRGRDLRRVRLARPAGGRLRVVIRSYNRRGESVVTRRAYAAC